MKLLLYDPNNHLADWKADSEIEPLVIRSPSGRFEIRYQVGRCHPPGKNGLDFGKAEIYDVEKKSLEAILVRDHYTEPAFDWVTRDGNCILIWASTYLKGFEVIDLNQKSLKHVEINCRRRRVYLA